MLILKLAGIIEKIELAYVWNHEGLELFHAFEDIEIWHRSLIVEMQNGIQKSLCLIHFQNSEFPLWITIKLSEDQNIVDKFAHFTLNGDLSKCSIDARFHCEKIGF